MGAARGAPAGSCWAVVMFVLSVLMVLMLFLGEMSSAWGYKRVGCSFPASGQHRFGVLGLVCGMEALVVGCVGTVASKHLYSLLGHHFYYQRGVSRCF